MNETKKVSKKQKAKKSNIRRNVLMIILCIALLSSATYAWFTLSNTAKITNLSLSVTESGGLLIAPENAGKTGAGDYGDTMELDMTSSNAKLLPATLVEDASVWKIYKPQYSENEVTDVVALTGSDKALTDEDVKAGGAGAEGYYYDKVFYLRVNAEGTYNISLKEKGDDGKGTLLTGKDKTGTDVNSATDLSAVDAVRIAFYNSTGDLLAVYKANSDRADSVVGSMGQATVSATASGKVNKYLDVDSIVKANQKIDGTIEGATSGALKLFTITGNADNKITMRVWIEGSDPQCANDIALTQLAGQIKFESSKVN